MFFSGLLRTSQDISFGGRSRWVRMTKQECLTPHVENRAALKSSPNVEARKPEKDKFMHRPPSLRYYNKEKMQHSHFAAMGKHSNSLVLTPPHLYCFRDRCGPPRAQRDGQLSLFFGGVDAKCVEYNYMELVSNNTPTPCSLLALPLSPWKYFYPSYNFKMTYYKR